MAASLTNLFDLIGKTAVVTGGGVVICGKIAEALAGNGVKIVLLDNKAGKVKDRAAAIHDSGGEVLAINVVLQIRQD